MPNETAATPAGAAPANDIQTRPEANVSDTIVDQLMGGKLDDVEVTTSAPEPPTPPPAAPAAPAAKPAEPPPAAPADPLAVATPPVAPTDAPPAPAGDIEIELPEVAHPYDDPSDPRIDDVTDGRQTQIRARFDAQREKLRAAREDGQFGRLLLDEAAQGGLEPATMAQLVTLTAKANRGDPTAKAELGTLMQRLGVAQPSPAAPPRPAGPDAAAVDTVYRELFKEDVESLNISEERARVLAEKVARERHDRTALSQPTPVTPHQPQQQAPRPGADPVTSAALSELDRIDGQFTEAFAKVKADFAPIRDEAQKRIAARVRASGPIPPIRWGWEFAQTVRQIQVEKAKAQQSTPAKPPVTAPLRSSTIDTSKTGGAGGSPDWRASVVDQMLTGRWED